MANYEETERAKDFEYFKSINRDFFAEHGHKFLAIKSQSVKNFADSIPELISKMNEQSFEIGTYLIQECTGDDSAFISTVMRLVIQGEHCA